MARAAIRWRFRQDSQSQWHWRRFLYKKIVTESQAFNDYGECVLDAIRNGFKPADEPYETVMKNGRTALYKKGRAPKIQQ
jgi:hypothetical protein